MQREQDFHIASLAISFLQADNIKVKAIPVSKFLIHSENLLGSNFNCHLFSISIHDQATLGTQRH